MVENTILFVWIAGGKSRQRYQRREHNCQLHPKNQADT